MELFLVIVCAFVAALCIVDRDNSRPSKAYQDMQRKRRDTLEERMRRHFAEDKQFMEFFTRCHAEMEAELQNIPDMKPPYKNRYDFESQEARQLAPFRRLDHKLEKWLDNHYPEEQEVPHD